jgi:hypothetical protein
MYGPGTWKRQKRRGMCVSSVKKAENNNAMIPAPKGYQREDPFPRVSDEIRKLK